MIGRALLDDARRVHHVHAVGVARDDPEVVGDHDHRDAEPARQVLHQFKDLRLDRHIERGGRFVGDDELRIAGEPDRDHHALAHAAGEVMRILLEPARAVGDADELEQFEGACRRLLVVHLQMNLQGLHHLLADGQHRIERGHRLLENHRDVAAALLAHLLLGEVEQVLPFEQDLALRHPAGLGEQAHDGERGYRFAAAGFPDHGNDLAPIDRIGDALDRVDRAAGGLEPHVQVADLKQRGRRSGLRARTRQCSHPVRQFSEVFLCPWGRAYT